MEVCLFDKHANASQLILEDITDGKDTMYFKHSLVSIKIFPSQDFSSRHRISQIIFSQGQRFPPYILNVAYLSIGPDLLNFPAVK